MKKRKSQDKGTAYKMIAEYAWGVGISLLVAGMVMTFQTGPGLAFLIVGIIVFTAGAVMKEF